MSALPHCRTHHIHRAWQRFRSIPARVLILLRELTEGIVAAGIIDIVELPLPRAVEMRHAAAPVAGGDECRPGGSIC